MQKQPRPIDVQVRVVGQEKIYALRVLPDQTTGVLSSLVSDVAGLKSNSFDLVMFDAKPMRECPASATVEQLWKTGKPASGHLLRLLAKPKSEERTWAQAVREGPKDETPSLPVIVEKQTENVPGILRVGAAATAASSNAGKDDRQEGGGKKKGQKQPQQQQQQQQKKGRPLPSQNVLLSDFIGRQLNEAKSQKNKKGKKVSLLSSSSAPVKISTGAGVAAYRQAPKRVLVAAPAPFRSNPNPADSKANIVERGKERMEPKKKKPTKLKKIILAEKAEKEQLKKKEEEKAAVAKEEESEKKGELDNAKVEEVSNANQEEDEVEGGQRDNEDEEVGGAANDLDEEKKDHNDDDDDADEKVVDDDDDDAVVPDHSDRGDFVFIAKPFSPIDFSQRSETELEMNRKIAFMLSELRRFQHNQKQQKKARFKPRLLHGLREVERAARRNKLKCAFLAPNVEDIGAQGGLNDLQRRILEHCRQHNIPLLICMTRFSLGKAIKKRIPVSAVGVFDCNGIFEVWREIQKMYVIVAAEREQRKDEPKRETLSTPDANVDNRKDDKNGGDNNNNNNNVDKKDVDSSAPVSSAPPARKLLLQVDAPVFVPSGISKQAQ